MGNLGRSRVRLHIHCIYYILWAGRPLEAVQHQVGAVRGHFEGFPLNGDRPHSWETLRKGLPTVNEKPLPKQLLRLKAKTSWSWERMCRELHRVMGEEGPSHTTLFRYASGRVKRPNVVTERYVQEAIQKVTVELSQK